MALASLTVDLTLGLAKFQGDSGKAARIIADDTGKMSRAAQSFEKQLERVTAQATKTQSELFRIKAASLGLGDNARVQGLLSQLKQAERIEKLSASATAFVRTLGGLGLVVSGGGLVALATNSAKAVDALNGLSAASGASVENVSALDSLARRTGVSFDALQGLLLQTNKALAEAKPDNAQGRALKALNLDVVELRKLDPAEALRRIAVALNAHADGSKKAYIQQALLNRQAKEGADFLRDLGGQTKLTGTITAEQAQKAEDFAKALAAMKAQSEDTARSLTLKLAPALTSILKGFNEGGAKGGLNAIGELTPFNQAFFDRLQIRGLEDRAKALRGVVNDPSLFDQWTGRIEDFRVELAQTERQLDAARAAYLRLTDGRAGGGRGFVNPEIVRPELPGITEHDDERSKAAERAARVYAELIANINERVSAEQSELASGIKLTQGQRFAIDTVSKLATGEAKLTDEQKRNVTALLERYLAIEQQTDAQQRAAESAQRWADAVAAARDKITHQRVAIDDQNLALVEQIATFGKSSAEVERWRIQQAEAALAAREAAIAIERASGVIDMNQDAVDAETEAMRRQIALRKELADLADSGATRIREASRDAAQSIASNVGDAIVNFTSLRDVITSIDKELVRIGTRVLVTEPLEKGLRGVFEKAVGSDGGFLGPLLGATSGGGADSAAAAAAAQATFTASTTTATAAQTALATATTSAATATVTSTAALTSLSTAEVAATTTLTGLAGAAAAAQAALLAMSASSGGDGGIVSGLFSSVGSFFLENPFAAVALADGTDYVPYDGFKATLHKGERVVPAKFNPTNFDRGVAGIGGERTGGDTYNEIHVHIEGASNADRRTASQWGAEIAEQLEAHSRRNR